MKARRLLAMGLLVLVGWPWASVQAGWSVGIGVGLPLYYRPWCGPSVYFYRPYPVIVEPAPVCVQPAPIYVQPAPVLQPVPVAPPVYQAPQPATVPTTVTARRTERDGREQDIDRNLQDLTNRDERVRAEAAIQLGRMRAGRALDPLATSLASDASPPVREAAARALGLIGSPRALAALRHAAQADGDRDVRHSAQFAVEVVLAGTGQ